MAEELVKIVDKTNEKNPAEREYLICLNLGYDDHVEDIWDIVTGRRTAYEEIKNYIVNYGINFDISFILVESLPLEKRRSIYSFMKYCEQFFDTDDFDVDEYVSGDWSEEDYKEENGIVDDLNINNTDKLDMTSIMNGEVESTNLN